MIQLLTTIFLWHAALQNSKKLMSWYGIEGDIFLHDNLFFLDYTLTKSWLNHSFILLGN